MRSKLTTFATVATVCVLSSAGVATYARSMAAPAAARSLPQSATPALVPAAPKEQTDVQRRAELNRRLHDMLREQKGGRLIEGRAAPSPLAQRPGRTAAARVRRPASTAASATARPASSTRIEVSTIAPPQYDGRPATASRGGYQPPRLDLVSRPLVPTDSVECLTQAIYYEARNESEDGQAAVAEVIINRSRAGNYPAKICDVVYQRNSRTCQFTFTCDGSIGRSPVSMTAWGRAERIAREVYEGRSQSLLPRTSVNYHANYVRPSWGRRLERVRQIGAHIFYGAPLNGHATPGSMAEPKPPAPTGLVFVRNEALDRAYALVTGAKTPT